MQNNMSLLKRQNNHQEHTMQGYIVRYLFRLGCRTIDTDVMDALKYLSPKDTDTPREKVIKKREKNKFIQIHHQRGYVNGQPDLVVATPYKKVLFIELKTQKGIQSDAQKDFQRQLDFMGFSYVIWRSLNDAVKYMETLKERYIENEKSVQAKKAVIYFARNNNCPQYIRRAAEQFEKEISKDYDVQTTGAGGLILDANAPTFKD